MSKNKRIGPLLDVTATSLKAAGWRTVRTPEERSKSAQKAAETRKARQVPVELKVNNIPIVGGYYPSYQGKVEEGTIYFTSRAALRRLGDVKMTLSGRYTDDYYGDAQSNFGRGATKSLADLLKDRPTRIYLRYNRANDRLDGKAGWYLLAAFHSYEYWDSTEALAVQIRKSAVPAPVDLPDLPMMPRTMTAKATKRKTMAIAVKAIEAAVVSLGKGQRSPKAMR